MTQKKAIDVLREIESGLSNNFANYHYSEFSRLERIALKGYIRSNIAVAKVLADLLEEFEEDV